MSILIPYDITRDWRYRLPVLETQLTTEIAARSRTVEEAKRRALEEAERMRRAADALLTRDWEKDFASLIAHREEWMRDQVRCYRCNHPVQRGDTYEPSMRIPVYGETHPLLYPTFEHYYCLSCAQLEEEEYQAERYGCSGCGQWKPRQEMRSVAESDRFPYAREGTFCEQCLGKALETYRRVCALCDVEFRAASRGVLSDDCLCPDCETPERFREARQVRIHLSRAGAANTVATLTIAEWLQTLDDFHWRCVYCGGAYEVFEHFVPITQGGGTTAQNCVPSCGACNSSKSNLNPAATPNFATPRISAAAIQQIHLYLQKREAVLANDTIREDTQP
ncbi:MAG TPA: HNH endonuclease [Ktedonobacterales bacterium]|jgi:5-methylcytosine-specific restriction endonuclease McrA|nr:HNH endonuclease [Ktedonobacterales bacterium]